jgi:hypothetical protein
MFATEVAAALSRRELRCVSTRVDERRDSWGALASRSRRPLFRDERRDSTSRATRYLRPPPWLPPPDERPPPPDDRPALLPADGRLPPLTPPLLERGLE